MPDPRGRVCFSCTAEEQRLAAKNQRDTAVTSAERLRAAGLPVATVSVGSTSTAVTYAEDLPIACRYWPHVFGTRLSCPAAVTVPDLRGVLAAVCQDELASGALVPLHEPDDPPINTGYLVQRPGRPDNPDVTRVRDLILEAGRTW
ncbi:hypothetical protein [Streptomyces coeruleorubidus]|uniref:hypothetical protein n=1 Tax=Streptomyces coeruleorubidus TaxID=116188 RepID=UPI003CD00FB2